MKTIQTAILAILAILAAPALLASPWVQSEGSGGNYGGYGPYQTGVGGEFTFYTDLSVSDYAATTRNQQDLADNPNGLAIPSFQTFCVSSVTFNAGTTYDVAFSGITDQNYALTAGVAWLYLQFQWGILGGYDYTDKAGRLVSAGALQDAIWALTGPGIEGQTVPGNAGNPFLIEAEAALGAANVDNSVPGGTDGVWILNLSTANVPLAQSQLYCSPDGGLTVALLGGALICLQALRRKM